MTRSVQSRSIRIVAIAAPILLAAVVLLQTGIDARTRSIAQQKEELLLQSPATAKKLSLGYDALLADVYWTRAVQLYGDKVGKTHEGFDLLYPLLNIATSLDPKLLPAYHFGAIFLSQTGIGGAGRPDLAVKLVQRGIAANPEDWHLDLDLGFIYYWWLRDYSDAAKAYLAASKAPGGPSWLSITAARMAQKGGSLEMSRMIWSQLYESSKDPRVRKNARDELTGLKALDDENHLNDLAVGYRQRFGHFPASSADLVHSGMLPGVPLDPAGFPYQFGLDGKAKLDRRSPVVISPPPPSPPPRPPDKSPAK
ncbi:MAG TPA: hypothetical protein VN661_00385 [Candidatus Acidoferrales bacterium]|nr:hypothetical protein [Candidatus Acidoferrales bacterium]